MAAEQGNADAQFNLGLMYAKGEGVYPHYAEAVKWVCKATEQDDAEAQFHLGNMYVCGDDPARNAKAYMWFSLAAAQGDEQAKAALGKIESEMTLDQIAKAQKRAVAWKPKAN